MEVYFSVPTKTPKAKLWTKRCLQCATSGYAASMEGTTHVKSEDVVAMMVDDVTEVILSEAL